MFPHPLPCQSYYTASSNYTSLTLETPRSACLGRAPDPRPPSGLALASMAMRPCPRPWGCTRCALSETCSARAGRCAAHRPLTTTGTWHLHTCPCSGTVYLRFHAHVRRRFDPCSMFLRDRYTRFLRASAYPRCERIDETMAGPRVRGRCCQAQRRGLAPDRFGFHWAPSTQPSRSWPELEIIHGVVRLAKRDCAAPPLCSKLHHPALLEPKCADPPPSGPRRLAPSPSPHVRSPIRRFAAGVPGLRRLPLRHVTWSRRRRTARTPSAQQTPPVGACSR